MILVFNSISHFLVDAACVGALYSLYAGSAVGTPGGPDATAFSIAVIIYNTLAFSTQCLIGMLLDRIIRQDRLRWDATMLYGAVQASAMFVAAAAAIAPLGLVLKAVLLGLANSVFHVSAGSVVLDRSSGKAAPLGLFVAPGAFGVTLGVLYPQILDYICLALGLCAVFCFSIYRKAIYREDPENDTVPEVSARPGSVLPAALLTAAVAVRAIGGSAAEFTWKDGAGSGSLLQSAAAASLLLTLFVFLGKALGGFICDRLGASKPSIVTIALAAVLTAFFARSMPLSLIGQLLLNLSMPVTLWLMFRHLPDRPGLAFGLAASALWPGTLIGGLIRLTGPLQSILIIVCFAAGIGAIIYADRHLPE